MRNFFKYVAMKKVAKSRMVAKSPALGFGYDDEEGLKSSSIVWLAKDEEEEEEEFRVDEMLDAKSSSKIKGLSSKTFFILLKRMGNK